MTSRLETMASAWLKTGTTTESSGRPRSSAPGSVHLGRDTFDVCLDHQSDERLEVDLRFPTEPCARARRIAHEVVELGGAADETGIARYVLMMIETSGGKCALDELRHAVQLARRDHIVVRF